jgi:hypothetical protein
MKMKNEKSYMIRGIRSFRDLQEETLRMKTEVKRVEERIGNNYSNLKEALSPANILKSVVEELTTSSAMISGIISLGHKIFKKRKKKNRRDAEAQS